MAKALSAPLPIEYDPAREPLLEKAWTAWKAGLGPSVTGTLFSWLGPQVDSTVFSMRDGTLTLEVRMPRLSRDFMIMWGFASGKVAVLCRAALAGAGAAVEVGVRAVWIPPVVATTGGDERGEEEEEEEDDDDDKERVGQAMPALEKMERGPKLYQLVNAWDAGFCDRLGELLGRFPLLRADMREGVVIGIVWGRVTVEVRSNGTKKEYPSLWEMVEAEMRQIFRPVLGNVVLVHHWPGTERFALNRERERRLEVTVERTHQELGC